MFRSLLIQKYQPIRKLAEGGMGEIYLARQVGQSGFQREVVLKRIHHRLSENVQAVEMFLDEARLAATLSHPNVVQIYDVIEEDEAYLIAMERVRGPSLRVLAESATRLGKMIPMELTLTIITQVLEGLRYAHTFRDENGRPLRIVHRDICPANILVSDDGVVKIADFGIARAENQLRREVGPRPGKFAYMSPETVRDEPLDARADLFSVGVLLYELTVGKRLFRAASFSELKRVVADPIPPPTFARAGYPVDLEILVMRALERNPDDRFQSAEAMLEAVEQFAYDSGMRLSHLRLARFLRRLLAGDQVGEDDNEDDAEESSDGEAEPAGEDLDFDGHGLFDQSQPAASASAADPEQERSLRVREAVKQANEAIADLVAASESEHEEQHTVQMRVTEQAMLRALSVAAEPDVPRRDDPLFAEASDASDDSAVVVTDELVEEEVELGDSDPGEDLLPDLPPVDRSEPSAPSVEVRNALADISAELHAAEESDRRRERALSQAVVSFGGEEPVRLLGAGPQRPPATSPPPAAVPPPPSTVPAPLLLDGVQAPSVPLSSIAPVRDELEAADGAGRRRFDDLELSDLEGARPDEPEGEEPELKADEPAGPPTEELDAPAQEPAEGNDDELDAPTLLKEDRTRGTDDDHPDPGPPVRRTESVD